MSNLEFRTKNVFPGTANQRKFGILATFNLDIVVDGQVIASAADLKVSKSKAGDTYISSPTRKYTKKDGTEGYISFFKLFPLEKDGASTRGIIEQVKRDCENHTTNSARAPNSTPSRPVSKPAPKTETATDAW